MEPVMKKFMLGVTLTLALLAVPRPTLGQDPAPAAKPKTGGPQIRFSEMAFDFGRIRSTEKALHNFIVTNVGDAELEITSVLPGCGCTTAGDWDRKIQPGQTGKIPIQFNPEKFNGLITNKYVSIACNDPAKANSMLYLHATVWHPIEVLPAPHLYFMPIEGETTNEFRTVQIVSNLAEPVTLDPPQCTNAAFKLELRTLKPGKEFELRVSYDPSVRNPVPSGQITIKTSTTNMPVLDLTTYAMVQPALVASPSTIRLPADGSPVGYRHSAVIQNRGSAPVKLSEIAVNAEGVKVEMVETLPGKQFTFHMDIPPNFQVHPGLELTARTTHPKYPVFHVPIVPPVAQTPVVVKPPVRPASLK
jgi:hypothetical protein